jgi:hypothetical protein
MRRSRFFQSAALGVTVLSLLGLTAVARAQHTPDPYNIVGEYNLGYEDYMYSSYPNGAGFNSSQAYLQGRPGASRANQFQSYLQDLDGFGLGDTFGGRSRGRGGIGTPYYLAHRQFDEAFDRIYTPNAAPDETYRADQEARTKLYIEYLKERDPKKRAQLFRAYNQQSSRSARDLSIGSARAASRSRGASSPSPVTSALSSPRASQLLRPPASSSTTTGRGAAGSRGMTESPEDILDRPLRRPPARSEGSSPTSPR